MIDSMILRDTSYVSLDERLNEMLRKMQEKDGKIISVQLTSCPGSVAALILVEHE